MGGSKAGGTPTGAQDAGVASKGAGAACAVSDRAEGSVVGGTVLQADGGLVDSFGELGAGAVQMLPTRIRKPVLPPRGSL
mmetsp:Transcript_136476/g.237266  ORF Transcript_136476/g.237266 Transcript_136476/m.237266 type:complete len:80 (+) Transcript_136476:320-559(+)